VSRIDTAVEAPGPWTHRQVAANGARFHVAEIGTGPLVLFLHGFPEFWWAWRHQLPAVAAAGFRAVAMDLRGYGGSDKPPRGYDPMTLSGDVAGVIRSLGARDAVVVGHGWGGFVGWATAAVRPSVVRGLGVVCSPHPLQMAGLFTHDRAFLGSVSQMLAMQVPLAPERRITADDCAYVEQHLRRGAAPGSAFPDPETAQRYRAAMRLWPAPHCALEYHRWLVRSRFRADGRRFTEHMRAPIGCPTLMVEGELDPIVPYAGLAARHYLRGPYRSELLPGVGHYPHEEAPDAFTKLLLDWLDSSPS
jgi:pimeloyl-ACP methyl ester carboxylesterase